VAGLGGRTEDFVPPAVRQALARKFGGPVDSVPVATATEDDHANSSV